MKKFLKRISIAAGVILLLAMVVPFIVPTDAYKGLIIGEAGKRISGRLEIGSMRIKLLPLPGFTLKDVMLSNTTGAFSGRPVVAAKEISGTVRLIPLFSREAVISLRLIEPEVHYNTAKGGRTNIEDLVTAPAVTGPSAIVPAPAGRTAGYVIKSAFAEDKTPAKATGKEWKVLISGLEIDDGLARITKEGEPANEIRHLDLKLSDFSPTADTAKAPFHFAAALFGSEKQNLKVDGKLDLDLKRKSTQMTDWKVVVGNAPMTLNAKADYSDPVSAELVLKMPKAVIGDILTVDPRIISSLPKDISRDALAKLPVSMDLSASLKGQDVDIKELKLHIGGTVLLAGGRVGMSGGMPVNIAAKLSPVRIGELKALVPALSGIGEIADPSISLKIGGSASNFKKLDLAGRVESKRVRYQDYEISDLKSDFRFGGDRMTLSGLSGNLYGGALKGSGSLLMAGEPAYDADVNISNVDMSLVPATKGLLIGRGALAVTASGKGTDANAIKKNLKANGKVTLSNGDIPSLKLGEKIFGSPAWNILAAPGIIINQKGLNELRSLDASCKDFTATFKIENGIITTPDIKWQHAKYRVQLSGLVSMEQALDYKGQFVLSKGSTEIIIKHEGARKILANSAGELAIPFNVGGTVSSPSVRPDEGYLASLFTKAVAGATIGRAAEAVKDAVTAPEKAGKKLLQGLFGR